MKQSKKCDRCLKYYKGIYNFKNSFYCYHCYRTELSLNRILNHFIDNPNKIFVVSDFIYEAGRKYIKELVEKNLIKKFRVLYYINGGINETNGYRLNPEKLKGMIELRSISQVL